MTDVMYLVRFDKANVRGLRWLIALAMALGLQSEAQAGAAVAHEDRGAMAYAAHCALCHGATLSGGFGPPLNTEIFRKRWASAPKHSLQTFISSRMPPAAPGGLDAATYGALTDFIDAQSGLRSARHSQAKADQVSPPTSEHAVPGSPLPENCDETCTATRQRLKSIIQVIRPVNETRLQAPHERDWLAWSGRASQSYSTLKQINRGNVRRLSLAWSLALSPGTNAIAPLVNDGVMFIHHSGTVQALDARSGDTIWSYSRPAKTRRLQISQPRGIALYENAVYVPTLDNHMLALDAKTGKLLWDHEIAPADSGLQITAAPLVAHGKVIQGMAGCFGVEYPGGCFIVALDAQSGKEVWRFDTIARPNEPGGNSWNGLPLKERFGASVWSAGSYDPELNLVYFGTSQTYRVAPLLAPLHRGHSTEALYSDTTLALNPDTGKLVWHYQHLPGDVWNQDWAFERTLIELPTPEGEKKAVLTVGKLGIVEALDAKTGQYLWSIDLGLQNLVSAIDPKSGGKSIHPQAELVRDQPRLICPSVFGARSWPTTAFDPEPGHLYVPLAESCMQLSYTGTAGASGDTWLGDIRYGELLPPANHDGKFGQVAAIDVRNRSVSWRVRRRALPASAALATAGGLLFEGSRDHRFRALDSSTGDTLWEAILNETPSSFPISFMVDATQYIAVATGGGSPLDASMRSFTPELPPAQSGTTLWAFSLRDAQ